MKLMIKESEADDVIMLCSDKFEYVSKEYQSHNDNSIFFIGIFKDIFSGKYYEVEWSEFRYSLYFDTNDNDEVEFNEVVAKQVTTTKWEKV